MIEVKNLVKKYGDHIAVDHLSFTVEEGHIYGFLGPNGAGKSTLMSVLFGLYRPEEGTIKKDGKEVQIRDPNDANALGIGMVHQHFKLVDVFTAAENVALGLKNEGRLDLKAVSGRIREICAKYGFQVDPDQKIYDMSVSQKQTVEIIKVLYRGADILILDEPTAVLTPQETDRLFDVLRAMRNDDKAIIIITHKLQEVLAISDRVTVLRKGEYIGTVPTSEATPQSLTDMMVGQATKLNIERPEPKNTKKLRRSANDF